MRLIIKCAAKQSHKVEIKIVCILAAQPSINDCQKLRSLNERNKWHFTAIYIHSVAERLILRFRFFFLAMALKSNVIVQYTHTERPLK